MVNKHEKFKKLKKKKKEFESIKIEKEDWVTVVTFPS